MNDYDRNDTDKNTTLDHLDVSSEISLLNIHALTQHNDSSNMNEMNISVENSDVNGDCYYMNFSTVSESNNHNTIDYKKKRDEIFTNRHLMKNNGLQDGVGIDVMLPASALNQYSNMEYNNEHHNLPSNGNISTSNNS